MSYFIYKIVCDDCPDFVYVGSSKNIRSRRYSHKHHCIGSNYKLYKTIREYGGWDNWRMVVIHKCDESVQTKIQACIIEEDYRVKLKAELNMKRAYSNKQTKIEQNRIYKHTHKEEIQKYRDINKDKSKEYYNNNKDKYKEYNDVNKDKVRQQKQEWYIKNKEKVKEKNRLYREKQKLNKNKIETI